MTKYAMTPGSLPGRDGSLICGWSAAARRCAALLVFIGPFITAPFTAISARQFHQAYCCGLYRYYGRYAHDNYQRAIAINKCVS